MLINLKINLFMIFLLLSSSAPKGQRGGPSGAIALKEAKNYKNYFTVVKLFYS